MAERSAAADSRLRLARAGSELASGAWATTFETCAPDVDEHVSGVPLRDIVRTLAVRKARAAAEHASRRESSPRTRWFRWMAKPLGKPADAEDAKRMLRALSGREHEVFTGVCVLDAETGREEVRGGVAPACASARLTDKRRSEDYVQTGEPMDKAGAYAHSGRRGRIRRRAGRFLRAT